MSATLQYYLDHLVWSSMQGAYKAAGTEVSEPRREDYVCTQCGKIKCHHDDIEFD
jgi:hypothetical protein